MDRRDFLKSLAALGLVAATPRLIFDLAKNRNQYLDTWYPNLIIDRRLEAWHSPMNLDWLTSFYATMDSKHAQ